MSTNVLKNRKGPKVTDEEFEIFYLRNPNMRIERRSNLEVIIRPPNIPLFAIYAANIIRQLANWNFQIGNGVVFASAGFTLSDNSILSPDASWMSNDKWNELPDSEKNRFSHICPEFIVEVRSKTDTLSESKKKMNSWMKNGAKLGWLFDPERKTYWVYRPSGEVEEITCEKTILLGEGPIEGFKLDLTSVFN